MAQLYNYSTNSYEEVPEEHIREGVLSKKYGFSDAEKVPVIARDGSRHFIPGIKAREAFRRGGKYGGVKEWAKLGRKEEYGEESFENYIGATATGLARGGTLGVSDMVLREIIGKERMQTWREEFPGVSTGAEIGGAILSGSFTGGLSTLGTGARVAAGVQRVATKKLAAQGLQATDFLALSKGAFKAGKGLEQLIAGTATAARGANRSTALKILQAGRGTLAKGMGGALEGAAFGAGTTLTEAMLGDPDEAAEMFSANVGWSMLFGGLGNAGIHAMGVGGAAAGKQMSEGIASLYEKTTGNKLAVAGQERFIKMTGGLLGVEDLDELVKQSSWAPKHRAARKLARETKETYGAQSKEIYNDLNAVLNDLEVMQGATRGKQKVTQMRLQLFQRPTAMGGTAWAANPSKAIDTTREALAAMWLDLASLGEAKLGYAAGSAKKGAAHLGILEDILTGNTRGKGKDEILKRIDSWAIEAKSYGTGHGPTMRYDMTDAAKDAFLMLDDFKKFLGHHAFGKTGRNQLEWGAQGSFTDAWKKVHGLLEDTNLWGKAAESQQRINRPLSRFINALQDFKGDFGDSRTKEWVSPQKIVGYLKNLQRRDSDGLDAIRGLNKERRLEEFFEAAQNYSNTANEVYGLGADAARAHSGLSARLPGSKAKIEKLTKDLKESRFMRDAAGGQGFHPRYAARLYRQFGYGAFGGFAFGIPGAAAGVVIGGLADGAATARKLAGIEYAIGRSRKAIETGLNNIVERMTGGGPTGRIPLRPNRTKLLLAPVAAQFGEEQAKDTTGLEDYRRAKARVQKLTQPESLMGAIDKIVEPVAHDMPNFAEAFKAKAAVAMEQVSLAFNKDSRTPEDLLMGRAERIPTDREKAHVEMRCAIIEDPIGETLTNFENGTLTATHVDMLEKCYPSIYGNIVAGMMERFSTYTHDNDTVVPWGYRAQASILFKRPFDASFKPDNLNVLQASYGEKSEEETKIKSSPLIKHPGLGPTEVERIMMG